MPPVRYMYPQVSFYAAKDAEIVSICVFYLLPLQKQHYSLYTELHQHQQFTNLNRKPSIIKRLRTGRF